MHFAVNGASGGSLTGAPTSLTRGEMPSASWHMNRGIIPENYGVTGSIPVLGTINHLRSMIYRAPPWGSVLAVCLGQHGKREGCVFRSKAASDSNAKAATDSDGR